MMREILFRGKCIYENKWVLGCLLIMNDGTVQVCTHDTDYDVHPATVGQYTGLTDKDGKRIFEGDVFESGSNHQYVIFHEGEFMLQGTRPKKITSLKKYVKYIEIRGNIHHNPELLGGAP